MNFTISLDYRSSLGPVRDQCARPTCLAHASTTAHEHARASTLPLSPEYLHYFASGDTDTEEGVDIPACSRALLDPGQPAETDCPYLTHDPPAEWTPPTDVTLHRRASTSGDPNPAEVQALLNAGRLPVLGIATTTAFHDPTPPWVISHSGPIVGFHAVVAVGLSVASSARRFLIRNSWGTAWADAGHAWLDDAFVTRHLRDVLVLTEEVT